MTSIDATLTEQIDAFLLNDNQKICIFYEYESQHLQSWRTLSMNLDEKKNDYIIIIYDGDAYETIMELSSKTNKLFVLTEFYESWMEEHLIWNTHHKHDDKKVNNE